MLAYLLILGMAYVVSYKVGVSSPSFGRAIAGFALAVLVAWIFGSILVAQGAAFLDGLLGRLDGGDTDTKQLVLSLFQRGLWWALIGAGVGAFSARRRIHRKQDVPASALPKWDGKTVLAVVLFGLMLAVVMPAYQDYAKRSLEPGDFYKTQQAAVAQGGASSEILDPNTTIPANAYPEKLPSGQIGQLSPASQPEWGRGDIVISPTSTDTHPAVDAATNEHLRRIYAAHPDADAIFASAEFRTWMARYPAYQRIAAEGSTQEVIEMFTAYKNQR
ncbi:TPA: hypothetical protein MXV30_005440 [Pseudomonas aeruginosa]|uniref:hypothetical protein n=1 Tax=Pseudomonas aeruginosa TaxID=287 RepID=UPI0022880AF8|nr:hypothetical protein [Pseudomonas aeruginosa]HCA6586548.1 hypothetical protein [Pseudomonas aeruginosa]HCE8275350.1 hypothetical protein [Pseudomonas aeruginosa]HCF4439132.1 hypothetical protein [Pseudomonas aeruginosa]HCW0152233.1 hypothetical protein [Pseudomonas aeruginosa]